MVSHKYEDHNSASLLVTILRPSCIIQADDDNFVKSNITTAHFETRTDILKSITEPFKLELGAEDREPFRGCWLETLPSDTCTLWLDKASRVLPSLSPICCDGTAPARPGCSQFAQCQAK